MAGQRSLPLLLLLLQQVVVLCWCDVTIHKNGHIAGTSISQLFNGLPHSVGAGKLLLLGLSLVPLDSRHWHPMGTWALLNGR